jgi:type II secretory pathway pseudopilin PulG
MATSNTQPSTGNTNGLLVVLAVAIIAIAAVVAVYLMQDNRSSSERVGDAIEAVPQGLDKAANQLGDQPPAKNVERNLGDAEKKVNEKVN